MLVGLSLYLYLSNRWSPIAPSIAYRLQLLPLFCDTSQPANVSTRPAYPVLQVFFSFDDVAKFHHLRLH
ncbi:hypothetical protein BDM02DRAFT_3116879 [Thelephora ganbajun]|uniref:Uncharacterized protein n=1 Tax=Thelephora ganbajun TaxID=370292 RepID=A0ACB6ZDP1_THEGA|nr:hypothetical protein BDM02DRAFT_3116879 [Thelephora ganbajun]